MALSQLQLRIERSIFETIRLVLVAEGYVPDISNAGLYGVSPYTTANEAAYQAAVQAIAASAKGFAVEPFNHSVTKGLKKVPRIVIIPRRSMPGDIGFPQEPLFVDDPNVVGGKQKILMPLESTHMYMDIHLVSGSAAQDRVLNAVLAAAMGKKKFLKYYDELTERFFVRQYNYYDIPDPIEGQEEKVYSYEVPDLYEVTESYVSVPLISEITMELKSLEAGSTFNPTTGAVVGGYLSDGGLVMDLDGITFN